jgi:predicted RNase H-like nuclease
VRACASFRRKVACAAAVKACFLPTDNLADVHVQVFAHFGEIIEQGPFVRIAVDMPIGLPERAGPRGGGAELCR